MADAYGAASNLADRFAGRYDPAHEDDLVSAYADRDRAREERERAEASRFMDTMTGFGRFGAANKAMQDARTAELGGYAAPPGSLAPVGFDSMAARSVGPPPGAGIGRPYGMPGPPSRNPNMAMRGGMPGVPTAKPVGFARLDNSYFGTPNRTAAYSPTSRLGGPRSSIAAALSAPARQDPFGAGGWAAKAFGYDSVSPGAGSSGGSAAASGFSSGGGSGYSSAPADDPFGEGGWASEAFGGSEGGWGF